MARNPAKGKRNPPKRREAALNPHEMSHLQFVADRFNELESEDAKGRERRWRDSWRAARDNVILALSSEENLIGFADQINEMDPNPFRSQIMPYFDRDQNLTFIHYETMNSPQVEHMPIYYLRNGFFQGNNWLRLKRCRKCEKWFVDLTRNHLKKNCSDNCRNLYWTRERRGTKKLRRSSNGCFQEKGCLVD